MSMLRSTILCFMLATLVLPAEPALAQNRDGRQFDLGTAMTEPAPRATEATRKAAYLRGEWTVEFSWFLADSLVNTASGWADINYMNRGHGLIERFFCENFDGNGNELSTLSFLVNSPSTGNWMLGVADSYTENVRVFDGAFDADVLSFETIIRTRGGAGMTHYRIQLRKVDTDHFVIAAQQGHYGDEFQHSWKKSYTRRKASNDFLATRQDFGIASPSIAKEAHQFDFLLGEWTMHHELTRTNGQVIKFPVNTTAVNAMNGHAIMEHSWQDNDPNVPDAATTIVRLYNRSMRRWESMYCSNRANSILFFGGVQEGEDIVLHPFEANTSEAKISYWIFHSMEQDHYGWYANTSVDRGASFKKTWIIEAQRNPAVENE